MKKKLITILIILAAVCALGTGALTAHAENGKANGGNAETRLLLPSSYEQYLELESPSDFAVSERYIAVADKQENKAVFYIYDRQSDSPSYNVYSYETSREISSLNLYSCSEGDFLFFIETGNYVYYIPLQDLSQGHISFDGFNNTAVNNPSTMLIHGNGIYSAVQTDTNFQLRYTTLNGLTAETTTTIEESILCTNRPAFASFGDSMYMAADDSIYQLTPASADLFFTVNRSINSFVMCGETASDIVYIDRDGYLYVGNNDASGKQLNVSVIKNIPSVFPVHSSETFFLLQEDNIVTYDTSVSSFINYTIGKYSSGENRLGQNASDISVNGNRIAIADTANSRVLIAEKRENGSYVYSEIQTEEFSPSLVCAGKSSIFISDGSAAFLYSYSNLKTPSASFAREEFSGTVYACTYSYGTYYIVTSGNQSAATLSEQDNTLERYDFSSAATSITSDIYGNLYLFINNAVYRYSPEEFVSNGNGTLLQAFAGDSVKLLSDYAGNLYAQTDGGVYLLNSGGNTSVFAPASLAPLVYYDGTPTVESFAFSFESGEVYILSDGFIAVTEEIGISSLNNLSSKDENGKKAYDVLYTDALTADSYTALQLVTVPAQSVAISLDFQGLGQSSDSLPYESYSKTAEERTGVVLARTVNGPIVGFFTRTEDPDSDVNVVYAYEVALILDTDDTLAYSDAAQENAAQSASVVENVGIYKYPQMRLGSNAVSSSEDYTDFLCIGRLEKGAQISLLARVDGAHLDSDYYFVSASVGGETVYGYIPASFAVQYGEAGGGAGGAEYRYARLDRGKSVTLYHTSANTELILSDEEELKIYYNNKDEHGNVYAVYETETGTYAGYIDPGCLYEATPIVMVTLALVLVVAAALIVSVCYLILRKQPTLQP